MNARENKARSGRRSPGFFLFSSLLLAVFQGLGQTGPQIRSLEFEGVAAVSVNELRDAFASKEGQRFSAEILNRDVQNLIARYNRDGFVFCSASASEKYSEDSLSVAVTITVKEGHRVVFGPIELRGNSLPEAAADVTPALKTGDTFHPRLVEEEIGRLLKNLESRGYPLASIRVDGMEFRPGPTVDSALVTFAVDLGKMMLVTDMSIGGNTVTRRSVIEREARFALNRPFSDDLAREIKRRLDRLGLFSSVSLPEFVVTDRQQGRILVQVKEGDPNRFDGILGYVPSAGGKKGYVTGLIDLGFRNLFGTARTLSVRWLREDQGTQDLSLRYHEPWIASIPLNAGLGFNQRKQDSTYLRRDYELETSYSVSEMVSLGLTFRESGIFPSPRINNPVLGSDTWSLGGFVWYDDRDDAVNPTQGALYRTSYEFGSKTASNNPATRVSRVTLDLEYYLPTASRQVLAFALHGRDIRSSVLEQGDLFRIGGTSTLRGYRESQFLCSRTVWTNIEYRFLPGRRSQLYGFLDAAYLALQEKPSAGLVGMEQEKFGYGLGARVDSGIGIIGFSIGVGEGDTFRTAKFHVRLINEF